MSATGPGRPGGGPGRRGPDDRPPQSRHGASGAGGGRRGAGGDERRPGRRALRYEVVKLLERGDVMERSSPGFFFQRCLAIWEDDLRGTIKDKAPELIALQMPPKGLPTDARPRLEASRRVQGDAPLHEALIRRQAETYERLRASVVDARALSLRSVSPLVTGIGQPHPLESGFAFLKPYGVPYVAGSGVKGAVRAACSADWEERRPHERQLLLTHYFGSEDEEPGERRRPDAAHRRGALMFLDLLPELPASGSARGWAEAFRVDIVNPHYREYYTGGKPPADWLQPKPSNFLTLRAGLRWTLYVLYAPPGRSPRPAWWDDVRPGIEAALTARGLGAKKSWGYGLFDLVDALAAPGTDGRAAAPATSPSAQRPGAPQTAPQPVVRPPVPPAASPAVRALEDTINRLKANEVRPRLSQLERDLAACPASERPRLLALLERRLESFGWRPMARNEFMSRLRPAGPGEAR